MATIRGLGRLDRQSPSGEVGGPGTRAIETVKDDVSGDADDLVEEDLLVEDISIDGMCGVY